MPQRALQAFGTIADWSIFSAAFGLISIHWTGLTVTDSSALIASSAALLIAITRSVKFLADARLTRAEAKIKETYIQPEVFHMLETLKCWNALDCPTREIFKPETFEQ